MSQNLKKCLKGNLTLLLLTSTAVAVEAPLQEILKRDIESQKNLSFEPLVRNWEKKYGSKAFDPLMQIAADRQTDDSERYIALMSAVKLGGKGSSSWVLNFLKEDSWMLRSGALRALRAIATPEISESVLPLLKDPALVVRAEAADTIRVLKPRGSVSALLAALEDPANYHGGKAQWVPQKALLGLAELKATESAPRLVSLLKSPHCQQDPEFLEMTMAALETITGKSVPGNSVSEKTKAWKRVNFSRPSI